MIFRQLFDSESSTYTYLLADTDTKEAVLIDPVIEKSERDAKLVGELGLSVKFVMNTHVHADHITGTGRLKVKSLLSDLKRKSLLFLETAPRLPVSSISCQWREGGYSSKGKKNMKRNSLQSDIDRSPGQDGERIQFGGCSLLVAETRWIIPNLPTQAINLPSGLTSNLAELNSWDLLRHGTLTLCPANMS